MKIITRCWPQELAEWGITEGIHVWTAELAPAIGHSADYRRLLSTSEMERALKFRRPEIRDQFIITRGILRTLLGHYLAIDPAAVEITYEASGKPVLASPGLYFNVTHSEELAAFAFTRMGKIGIDIEVVRPRVNIAGIVERYFTRGELAAFQATPLQLQEQTFFTMWTRKEALLKASGLGIQALELCEVTIQPGQPARVLKLMDDENCEDRWLLKDLPIAQGYAAAIALELPQIAHGPVA
jgi:4'-phosphopantetheinyl transferase